MLSAAWAATVVCDPEEAARVLEDARIDELRAPITHPTLVPGLALATPRVEPALREAVEGLCAEGELAVERGDRHVDAGWAAHTVVLSSRRLQGCTLAVDRVAISIGTDASGPHYSLGGLLPSERIPVGDCDQPARFRDEEVVAGQDGPVRLVVVSDRDGDTAQHHVVVRRASPAGWHEQVLLQTAPDRLTGGTDGPTLSLSDGPEGIWIVAHGDRSGSPCSTRPGQTVWTPDGEQWVAHEGRDALTLLAGRGAWRLAGSDAWFLILAQDDEDDVALVEARMGRLETRDPEPLQTWPSEAFPELRPGFVFVAPAPWADEASAQAAAGRWRRGRAAYVKRAWQAPDPCR